MTVAHRDFIKNLSDGSKWILMAQVLTVNLFLGSEATVFILKNDYVVSLSASDHG